MYDIGRQFFLWEMAVAIAGHIIGINPFNQPNVEITKVLTKQMVADYTKTGALPNERKSLESDQICVYGSVKANTAGEALIVS